MLKRRSQSAILVHRFSVPCRVKVCPTNWGPRGERFYIHDDWDVIIMIVYSQVWTGLDPKDLCGRGNADKVDAPRWQALTIPRRRLDCPGQSRGWRQLCN